MCAMLGPLIGISSAEADSLERNRIQAGKNRDLKRAKIFRIILMDNGKVGMSYSLYRRQRKFYLT